MSIYIKRDLQKTNLSSLDNTLRAGISRTQKLFLQLILYIEYKHVKRDPKTLFSLDNTLRTGILHLQIDSSQHIPVIHSVASASS